MQRRYHLAHSMLTEVFIVSLMGFAAGVDARSQIAYDSEARGNREIYVMDIERGNLRNLTNHRGLDSHPGWSPSGTLIAFASSRHEGVGAGISSSDIYVMGANGENPRGLTVDARSNLTPDWSRSIFTVSPSEKVRVMWGVLKDDGRSDARTTGNAEKAD